MAKNQVLDVTLVDMPIPDQMYFRGRFVGSRGYLLAEQLKKMKPGQSKGKTFNDAESARLVQSTLYVEAARPH